MNANLLIKAFRKNNFSSEVKPVLIENNSTNIHLNDSSELPVKQIPEQNSKDLKNSFVQAPENNSIPILFHPNSPQQLSNNFSYSFQVIFFKIIYKTLESSNFFNASTNFSIPISATLSKTLFLFSAIFKCTNTTFKHIRISKFNSPLF